MKIRYARVSTQDWILSLQRDALETAELRQNSPENLARSQYSDYFFVDEF